MNVAKMQELQPVKTGIANELGNRLIRTVNQNIGFVYNGYININKTGIYEFYTTSDDGSLLYIDEELVVDNNGDHGMDRREWQSDPRKRTA
ncbi:PA14 domain-containing protein [Ferruginibacter sp.]